MLEQIASAFFSCLNPMSLALVMMGVAWGIIGGAIPGISPSIAIVLALPFTYHMETAVAVVLLGAVYTGACYGSSIPAILIGTPGAPASAATVADGYMLGKQGKGLDALGASLLSGVSGGIIGTLILCVFVVPLGKIALSFGAPEYFAICILGLTIVASVGGGNMVKAGISVVMGLAVATIGLDAFSGSPRFTMGIPALRDGINDVSAMIGLFAVGEVLNEIFEYAVTAPIKADIRMKLPLRLMREKLGLVLRSGVIGTFVGILPGAGSSLSGFVAYASAKNISRHPEEFGQGSFEGLIAPETANNACVGGSLVPVLALGVPGSPAAAMILAAFIMHGIVPGPVLFQNSPQMVYTIFIGLLIAQILLFFVGYAFIKPMLKIIDLDKNVLNVLIMILVLVGAYSLTNGIFEPAQVLAFGVLGFWVKRNGYSPSALVLGLVLGSMIENEFRRSLIMSGGSYAIFFTRPLCLVILLLSAASLVLSIVKNRKARGNDATIAS